MEKTARKSPAQLLGEFGLMKAIGYREMQLLKIMGL